MTTQGTRKRALEHTCIDGCSADHSDVLKNLKGFATIDIIKSATERLAAADPRLQHLIAKFGPPERLLAKNTSCFTSLAKSILYQQLAGTAAAAIYSRFLAVCGVPDESHLTPAAVLSASPAALRGCGLSERKASYLQDLAAHFADDRLSDELLTSLSDEQLLSTLTAVRGVGPWTVDMFSMFHLGRPDILPVGDLGVRKGLAHICGLSHLPSPTEMEDLTQLWRPFRSLGCYYMWRIPLPPTRTAAAGRGKGGSSKAGKKAAAARVKAPVTSIASPLGAAVAAVADVGVNPLVPMLAAGSAGVISVVHGAVQCADHAAATGDSADAAMVGGAELPPQLVLQPTTPAKQQSQVAGGTGSAQHGTPSALMQQLPSSNDADPAAAATNEAAAGNGGMLTRRRLKWVNQGQQAAADIDSGETAE